MVGLETTKLDPEEVEQLHGEEVTETDQDKAQADLQGQLGVETEYQEEVLLVKLSV